jgi:hypothetical protein
MSAASLSTVPPQPTGSGSGGYRAQDGQSASAGEHSRELGNRAWEASCGLRLNANISSRDGRRRAEGYGMKGRREG